MTDDRGRVDFESLFQGDRDEKRRKKANYKEVLFKDYLEMLESNSKIAQNAHARMHEMVLGHGTQEIQEEERRISAMSDDVGVRFNLFAERLFGLETPVFQFMKYLEAGANGLSTGKCVALLVGPTASGKSTAVNILKKALERYDLRPVFAIKGCPIREEPLHLLPRHLQSEIGKKLNLRIKGDLCPQCRHMLKEKFTEADGVIRWWDVPVETFTFSIQGTRGIGSFEPSDEKSQDVTELVGRENIMISSTKGPDHPLAFSLSGELEKANRGLCEGRELIKADEKMLWVFISVAEEQEIKVQGSSLPHLAIDTVVIGHTNLTEFIKFSANQGNEALHDRIYVIPFPYPLRIKDEVRIYQKLIREESDFSRLSKCHIAPGSLEIAALFAILTRLTPSQTDLDILTKAKLYNGDKAISELRDQEKNPIDLRSIREEGQSNADISKREGMFGISSRDILAAINTELVKKAGNANGCLTPLSVIRALRGVFDHRIGYTPEEVDKFKRLLSDGDKGSVIAEYKDYVVKSVSKAYLRAYNDLARELFDRYMKEIELHRNQKRKFFRGNTNVERDGLSGKPKEPDLKLIRSIETHIPLDESQAEIFRGEILEFKSANPNFSFDTYEPLAKAVQDKLLADSRATLSLVLGHDKPKGEEEKKRAKDLFEGLSENGFCRTCAKEMIEKTAEFLSSEILSPRLTGAFLIVSF